MVAARLLRAPTPRLADAGRYDAMRCTAASYNAASSAPQRSQYHSVG